MVDFTPVAVMYGHYHNAIYSSVTVFTNELVFILEICLAGTVTERNAVRLGGCAALSPVVNSKERTYIATS